MTAQVISLIDQGKIGNIISDTNNFIVLLLGRFNVNNQAIESLKHELKKRNYIPIDFRFDIPNNRDVTETVVILSGLSRFIIADLTEPKSVPHEIRSIVPQFAIPLLPIINSNDIEYSMFKDLWKYKWVLDIYKYDSLHDLTQNFDRQIITPLESMTMTLNKIKKNVWYK